MPNYLYKCRKCNYEITVVKPMSEVNSPEYCNKCNKELIRVYTPTKSKWNTDGAYDGRLK